MTAEARLEMHRRPRHVHSSSERAGGGGAGRSPLQGLVQVVRFNPHLYGASALILAAVAGVLLAGWGSGVWRSVLAVGGGLTLFWTVSSLAVSHWVYDRSGLWEGIWLVRAFMKRPRRWLVLSAGFDEVTPLLRERLGSGPTGDLGEGRSLDLFDPEVSPEPSVARARRLARRGLPGAAAELEPADFRNLPVEEGSTDAVFLVFAAHEWRRAGDREVLFREAARVLAPGGRLIVIEHLRDLANFLAFGPGFLHFLPRRSFARPAERAGLALRCEVPWTPFVRLFVWEKPRCRFI